MLGLRVRINEGDQAQPQLLWDTIWSPQLGRADWGPAGAGEAGNVGGLRARAALHTAIVICLFTDRRITDNHPLRKLVDDGDARGWFGDGVDVRDDLHEVEMGSLLWIFERSYLNDEILQLVETEAREALQPLIAQGAAASIDVKATRPVDVNRLDLSVQVYGKDGQQTYVAAFEDVWQQSAASPRSPAFPSYPSRPSWIMPDAVFDAEFAEFVGGRAWPYPIEEDLVDSRSTEQWVTTSEGLLVRRAPGVLSLSDFGTDSATENLLRWSQDFNNETAWLKAYGPNSVVTPNAIVAPDGTMTGTKLACLAAGGGSIYNGFYIAPNAEYVWSIYLKKGSAPFADITLSDNTDSGLAIRVNLTNGIPALFPFGVGSLVSSAFPTEMLAGGWMRVAIRFKNNGTDKVQNTYIGPIRDVNGNFVQNAGDHLFAWGAQIKRGIVVSDYLRTYDQPRMRDPSRRGLLIEPSSQNVLTKSEEFDAAAWTKSGLNIFSNIAFSPNGTLSADYLGEDLSNFIGHFVLRNHSRDAVEKNIALSVYVKPANNRTVRLVLSTALAGTKYAFAFYELIAENSYSTGADYPDTTFSVDRMGNGWYRINLSIRCDAANSVTLFIGTPDGQGDGTSGLYAWGAQLEDGVVPSSYIPSEVNQAARAANAVTLQRSRPGRVVFTFDDNSQQTIAGISRDVPFTIPTNLNRRLIRRMTGYLT